MIALLSLTVNIALQSVRTDSVRGDSLQAYLAEHPVDVASLKGPLLILDPVGTRRLCEGPGLSPFGLKAALVGRLNVWAPTEMVVLDANVGVPANLYEALPRPSKVVCLASLFSPEQWSIASTKGIGLQDLRGDQASVFRSILPKAFSFKSQAGYSNENAAESVDTHLKPEDLYRVRIKLYEDIGLRFRFAHDKGSTVVFPTRSELNPASPLPTRVSDGDEDDPNSLFGLRIRKVLPNTSKPSQLRYSDFAFDRPIKLSAATTVREICQQASRISGHVIQADPVIEGRTVQTFGVEARVGDVLQGLALCLCGTFRRVGAGYLLTADVEGLGTKQAKIAAWYWDLSEQTREWVQHSKDRIAGGQGVKKLLTDLPNAFQLNDAMADFMAKSPGDRKPLSVDDLPTAWRNIAQSAIGRYPSGKIDESAIDLVASVSWGFVLPDGRALSKESSLGRIGLLEGQVPNLRQTQEALRTIVENKQTRAVLYRTEDPRVARVLPIFAAKAGFGEVWVQTFSSECARELVKGSSEAKVDCRLVIRPWEVPPGRKTSDPDRTILGESWSEAVTAQSRTAWWRMNSDSVQGDLPRSYVSYGPEDPDLGQHWDLIAYLARTNGLAGCVLLDSELSGYEPLAGTNAYAPYSLMAPLQMGFTGAARSRFVARYGTDPVDFLDPELDTGSLNLEIPFFTKSPRSRASVDLWNAWHAMLSDSNRRALADLQIRIKAVLLLFEARHRERCTPHWGPERLTQWSSVNQIPELARGVFEEESTPHGDFMLLRVPKGIDMKASRKALDDAAEHAKASKGATALDLCGRSFDDVVRLLSSGLG